MPEPTISRSHPASSDVPDAASADPFRRVLLGSGDRGAAPLIAAAEAIVPHADITLAKVYAVLSAEGGEPNGERLELARQAALDALRRERSETGREDLEIRALRDRTPALGLARWARAEGTDLLVLGTASRGLVGRYLIGDTVHATLDDQPCPVLVVPRMDPVAAPPTSIGVAYVNGDDDADRALALAHALAERTGATLQVVEVIGRDRRPTGTDRVLRAQRALDERLGTSERVSGEVRTGRPLSVLADLVGAVDLVVCGATRERDPWRRLLPGTAERLALRGRCPVLVVPPLAMPGTPRPRG